MSSITQTRPDQRGGPQARLGSPEPCGRRVGVVQDSRDVPPAVRPEGGSLVPTSQPGSGRVCRAKSILATLWPLGSPDGPAFLLLNPLSWAVTPKGLIGTEFVNVMF